MHYTIYQITNLVNGKVYIGAHKTKDLEDDYMGSGKILKRAIEKYSIENFSKEILADFATSEEMFNMESTLVNEDFIACKTNYNIKLGGCGGFDYINKTKSKEDCHKHAKIGYNANKYAMHNHEKSVYAGNRSKELKKGIHAPGYHFGMSFKGKKHTEETKEQMRNSHRGKHTGSKNSNFGNCWIYNLLLKESKSIPKDSINEWLSNGWVKGRKFKF